MKVMSGLDVLVREGFSRIKGLKLGIVANQSTVDSNYNHAVDLLFNAPGITLKKIFGPEHGFRGAAQDMEGVTSSIDKRTGLEVITLYGGNYESLKPKKEHFAGLDAIVIDLPDIGTRYYTFAQTMAFAMETAGALDLKVFVLDRPNPLNGSDIEGAPLQKSCRSFCGLTPVAHRHGLTLGELAQVYLKGFGEGDDRLAPIPCNLEVVKMQNWSRSMWFDETGLPWVIPSPNMPTFSATVVYPGGCLFEATKVSEARGTTKPFEFIGAPYIDGFDWAEATLRENIKLHGAKLRPISFTPKFHKHANQYCGGVEIHVTDRKSFRSLRWGLAMISALRKLYGNQFEWRTEPYEFVDKVPAIDLLYGSPSFRQAVDGNGDLGPIEQEMERFESWFAQARQPFLMY